jgi:hypothetical protein
MGFTVNSWQLVTCSCVVHEYFDSDLPPEQQVRTFFAVENTCAEHAALIGLDNGPPDWVQPDHTVEAENAARFALYDAALEANETKNLQSVAGKPPEIIAQIQSTLTKIKQEREVRYANMFQPQNAKAISKAIYSSGREENERWDNSIQTIIDNGPAGLYDIVEGGTARVIKKSIIVNFSWSGTVPNRVLTITVVNFTLTNNQRTTIQNRLNTIFGVGKVILG